MASLWKVVLCGLLLTPVGSCTVIHSAQVADYVASLIRHLSDEETGTFDCWFYETSKVPQRESILDAIITSDQLCLIPRRVLNEEVVTDVQRSPGLLVLNFAGNQFDKLQSFLYSSFDRVMKVIALYDSDNLVLLKKVVHILEDVKIKNLVYLAINNLSMQHKETFQDEIYKRSGFVPFHEVFTDPTRNLTGHTFHFSLSDTMTWNSDLYNRYPTHLFGDTIGRLGGRSELHLINCENVSLRECNLKTFMYNFTTMFDFGMNTLSNTRIVNENTMHSMVPNKIQVAAPSGRRLSSLEVLVAPFRLELWISLILLLLVNISVMILYPKWFQNDLILLPLCGFERRQFYHVSTLEKMILIILILIYFVLSKSYETKFVALMADFPYENDPRTLEDLLYSGTSIQQSKELFQEWRINEDAQLKQLFSLVEYDKINPINWNSRKLAYIASESHLFINMHNPRNIDPKTGHRRFIIVDQFSLGIHIGFYFTSYRNPLVPKLQRAELQLFEGGFTNVWLKQSARHLYGARRVQMMAKGFTPVGEDIGFDELEPAWYAAVIGWGFGSAVLGLEICWFWLRKRIDFSILKYLQQLLSVYFVK